MSGRCVWIVLAYVACAVSPGAGDDRQYSASEVSGAFQKRSTDIVTLRAVYTREYESPLGDSVLFEEFGMLPPPSSRTEAVYHADGRSYVAVVDPWTEIRDELIESLSRQHPELRKDPNALFTLPWADVGRQMRAIQRAIQPIERIRVFDGAKLWWHDRSWKSDSLQPSQLVFDAFDATTPAYSRLPETILDWQGYAFAVTALPAENERRSKHSVSGLQGALPVADLNGAQCVVLAQEHSTAYLDVDRGFAIRRRDKTASGHVIERTDFHDLQELIPGVWLAKEVLRTEYIPKDHTNASLAGRPLIVTRAAVSVLEANRPEHLPYLSIEIPPGATVADSTLEALDESTGKLKQAGSIVSYTMPARQSELDAVIHSAQLAAGKERPNARLGAADDDNLVSWIVWFNVIAGFAALAVVLLRRRRTAN